MKLFYSVNSPFVRKCRVVALEKGLEKRIELVTINPMENPQELLAVNPLGTIPALITEDGLHLCDSAVICEYLDSLAPEPVLYPKDSARICALAMAEMADGMMNAAVSCVLERRRPADKQSNEWIERKEGAILRTIGKFAKVPLDPSLLSIGTINLTVALSYVSFRFPHLAWREAHPGLTSWYDDIIKRPSFVATAPAP